ncbi:hypothetical protein F5884DRAFT_675264 [Xylogone sp. PMI_703]|nr:hypothetical protein F5884DRAFT_675264 [Xylogone sp. PMI_703]
MDGISACHEVPTRALSLNVFFEWKTTGACKSNCPRIEVDILYPLPVSSDSSASEIPPTQNCATCKDDIPTSIGHVIGRQNTMAEIGCACHNSITTSKKIGLLDLPLELRLKIYDYLLPARTHKIMTQLPHNGFFYNTSIIPEHSATSFYPFGRCGPKEQLTTYKVITTNFRKDYPEPSIYPSILGTCKQIREEAEPVLYGSSQTLFDFGSHLDAFQAFFKDRSSLARRSVKNIRIAREITYPNHAESLVSSKPDPAWITFSNFILSQFQNLRTIDLILWASGGSGASFPATSSTTLGSTTTFSYEDDSEVAAAMALVQQWKEWDWTQNLLNSIAYLKTRITWWQFNPSGELQFDPWLAKRMAIDPSVKDKMVRNGVLTERTAVF